ncbi:MAG: hypothetical protein ACD_79C00898G0001, partial [uncultured bacterium]
MDTYVTIFVFDEEDKALYSIDKAFERMKEIDTKFNHLNSNSPIYNFNMNNIPITDPEIISLVKKALYISSETDGAFDITIAPLIELWGFYAKQPRLPTPAEIELCLKDVGYQNLELSNQTLMKKNPETKIDLGGIAKGYSIAESLKVLKSLGIANALIDAGGDVYALGKKDNKFWKIGIKDPFSEGLIGYIEIKNNAVMGSGDYERFFEEKGKKYHHIFNPKTGYPTEGVTGITLIYPEAAEADAWATALFVMPPEQAIEKAKSIKNLECLIVLTSGKKLYTSKINRLIKSP